MSLAADPQGVVFDEYGRPFVILREHQEAARVKGLAAQKANILAARSVSQVLRTSLGPKGMDKMLVNSDGEVTVSNDGATILEKMAVEHQVCAAVQSCRGEGARLATHLNTLHLAGRQAPGGALALPGR